MGYCQNSAEAYQRFKNIGIDAHLYMGDYGQKDFFLDVETGAITADEFCRKLEEITGKESLSWQEVQHCWLGFIDHVPEYRLQYFL